MTNKHSKLTLKLDTLRVLSSLEMSRVVGGLAIAPVQAIKTNSLVCTIHCTSACDDKRYAAAIRPAALY
ncbi:MAG: hypothetical protein K2Y37_22880 [Pirellulales bacterium]|nr:hypothetical protein [Pirellulales bacterium]